ncbi:MAG: N-acetyltransferase [Rhodobacteraceae bacterium]|nr:N-acetyltransferase [Paracoccaceae bacterium]
MTDDITHEDSGSKGRYVLRRDGSEAELTYFHSSSTMIIANHTGVPDEMRGTGAGLMLIGRLVADAWAGGYKIMALCPFVRSQTQKHPEWADAFV